MLTNLADLQARAIQIRDLYTQYNRTQGRPDWTGRDYALGMVGDIGSLAKAVMVADGLRAGDPEANPVKHHLADMLWSVLVLADAYDIDLTSAFDQTMVELEAKLKER